MLRLRWLTSCLRCSGLFYLGFAHINVMIALLLLWCSIPNMMASICFDASSFAGCFIAGCVLLSVDEVPFPLRFYNVEVSHGRIGAFLLLLLLLLRFVFSFFDLDDRTQYWCGLV